MPLFMSAKPLRAQHQQIAQALGLTPTQMQVAMEVLETLAPATGPSGFALGMVQGGVSPSVSMNLPGLLGQQRQPRPLETMMRATQPSTPGQFQTESPAIAQAAREQLSPEFAVQPPQGLAEAVTRGAIGLLPLMLGRPVTRGQQRFRASAKPIREQLRGTRVAEGGKPKRVFHGTPQVFERFDVVQADANALYGPGIYFTENPRIAGGAGGPDSLRDLGYAGSLRAEPEIAQVPNVRPAFLDIKRPFDIEGQYSRVEAKRIIDAMELDPSDRFMIHDAMQDAITQGRFSQAEDIPGDLIYRTLEDAGLSRWDINRGLRAAAFDGITHIGGGPTGNEPHRVWIAFSPEQVIPAFAPGAPTSFRPKRRGLRQTLTRGQ